MKGAKYTCLSFCALLVLFACRDQFSAERSGHPRLIAAEALDQAGDVYNAATYLRAALEHAETRDAAREYLAKIEERKGQAQDCLRRSQSGMDMTIYERSIYRYHFQMGVCFEILGKHEEAMAKYDKSIELRTRLPVQFIRRGLLRERLGDGSGALADLERAAAMKADYYPALFHLGLFHARRGDANSARARAESLKTDRPIYAKIIQQHLSGEIL